MRAVIYAALLLAAPAAAEPTPAEPVNPGAATSKPCQVTIVRAPDEVKPIVEQWVLSEPQCSVTLEIRIVPTEGGLYLLAQDADGGTRERIVPDAQSAGVLIASWIADDNAPAWIPPPAPTVIPEPARTPVIPTVESDESLTPPGLAPFAISTTTPKRARKSRWLGLGAVIPIAPGAGGGFRAELDLLRKDGWSIGTAASLTRSQSVLRAWDGDGEVTTTDVRALVTLAWTAKLGRWELRPEWGVGFAYANGNATHGVMEYALEGGSITMEASLMIGRKLNERWSVYGQPISTLVMQEFEGYDVSNGGSMTIARGAIDVALFAGARYRL